MTRPRRGPGRVTSRENHPTARGQILDLETIAARRKAVADLQQIRRRDEPCDDPDCPNTGERHVEELCHDCTVREGRPVYHLAE